MFYLIYHTYQRGGSTKSWAIYTLTKYQIIYKSGIVAGGNIFNVFAIVISKNFTYNYELFIVKNSDNIGLSMSYCGFFKYYYL